mmetsp:Transcript_375/g.539  ORF Transcript_375/g.539 Transcript_375/m.539 type:complete len:377 (-) Transcript_375:278-1408(-)
MNTDSSTHEACSILFRELTRRPKPYLNKIRSIIRRYPEVLSRSAQTNVPFAIPIVVVCTGDNDMISQLDKIAMIKLLAQEGIRCNVSGTEGRGGLAMNLRENDTDEAPITTFHIVTGKNDVDTLRSMAEMNPPLLHPEDVEKFYLLHLASSCGHLEATEFFLQLNPHALMKENNDGNCPIHIAAMKGNMEVFRLLLETGRRLNFGGEIGTGGLFVKRGSNDDRAHLTALDFLTIQSPQEWDSFAPYLRQYFAGLPLLQRAVRTGHTLSIWGEIVSLISHFDCAFIRDDRNRLPIMVAAECGLKWNNGMKEIIESNFIALKEQDEETNLPPFALAAAASNNAKDLTSVFELIRHDPDSVLTNWNSHYSSVPKRRRVS